MSEDFNFWIWVYNNFLSVVGNFFVTYATALAAVGSLSAALIALYLGDFKKRFEKPVLKLSFKSNNEYPYFQKLAFNPYLPVRFAGNDFQISTPGINVRLKVNNYGKSTAKKVQARVDKICFKNPNTGEVFTRYYHPTVIKWSGNKNWQSVDIVPNSHFFLDIFLVKNETAQEIFWFNNKKSAGYGMDETILKDIIRDRFLPSEDIFWSLWVDTSYLRGIPEKYFFDGDIIVYFTINAENANPINFEFHISWHHEKWDCPSINIISKNKVIDE